MSRWPDDPDAYVPVCPTPITDLPERETIWRAMSCRDALSHWCDRHGYHTVASPDFPIPPEPSTAMVQMVMRPAIRVRVRVAPVTIKARMLYARYPSFPGIYLVETLGPEEPRS